MPCPQPPPPGPGRPCTPHTTSRRPSHVSHTPVEHLDLLGRPTADGTYIGSHRRTTEKTTKPGTQPHTPGRWVHSTGWTVPCPLPTMHVEEDRRAVKSPRPLLRWRSAPPRRTAQSVPLLVRAITCTGPSDSSIEYLPGPCTTSCSSAPTVESCWLGLGLGLELGQQRAHRRELLRETVPLLSTRTPYCSQLTACC